MERPGLFRADNRQTDTIARLAGFEPFFDSAQDRFLDGASLFGRAGL